MKHLLFLAALLGSAAPVAAATIRYIAPSGTDTGTCTSQSSPCATIGYVNRRVAAGDTVYVAPGSYAGPVTTNTAGTSGKQITYISTVKWAAIIQGSGVGGKGYIAGWESDGAYTTINGFQVAGAGVWRFGVYMLGTGDIAENNLVHDIGQQIGCDTGGGGGVESGDFYNATNITLAYNVAYNIGPPGACAYFHGIYVTVPQSNI